MTWFTYALISAVLLSVTSLLEKKALKIEHAAEFSTVLAIMNAIVALPLFFLYGVPKLTIASFLIVFLVSILAAVAYLLTARSVRHLDISITSPFFMLVPGLTALLAFVLLGESLAISQIAGLLIMLGGSYVLQLEPKAKWRDPIKEAYKSKYIHFLVIAIFVYSATSLLDRYVLSRQGLHPGPYLALVQIFVAIHFLIFITLFYDGYKGIKHGLKESGPLILLVSLGTVGYLFAQLQATSLAYVGLVSAVKRSSSLFTAVIGGEIFHEEGLLRKGLACLIMIVGLALLFI
jgi:drug/metabolite transporter (DMT)-like permease